MEWWDNHPTTLNNQSLLGNNEWLTSLGKHIGMGVKSGLPHRVPLRSSEWPGMTNMPAPALAPDRCWWHEYAQYEAPPWYSLSRSEITNNFLSTHQMMPIKWHRSRNTFFFRIQTSVRDMQASWTVPEICRNYPTEYSVRRFPGCFIRKVSACTSVLHWEVNSMGGSPVSHNRIWNRWGCSERQSLCPNWESKHDTNGVR